METVEKMITFFRSSSDFINAKEPKTGHTALHHAARHGHFVRMEIVKSLVELLAWLQMAVDAKEEIFTSKSF